MLDKIAASKSNGSDEKLINVLMIPASISLYPGKSLAELVVDTIHVYLPFDIISTTPLLTMMQPFSFLLISYVL